MPCINNEVKLLMHAFFIILVRCIIYMNSLHSLLECYVFFFIITC